MTLVWDQPKRVHSDRIFFTAMAIAAAVVVLAGFAPSYYLRSASLPPLTPLYQLHGFLFTTWIGVFIAQNALIAGRRADLHRRVGIAGAVLAAAVLVTGTVVSIETLRRGGGGQNPQRFLSIPLGDITAFGALVAAGLLLRHHAAAHKRLMLFATISLLAAGFGRGLNEIHIAGRVPFFLCTAIFAALVVAYDLASRGRIHPATFWGGLTVAAFKPALYAFSATPLWLAFVNALR